MGNNYIILKDGKVRLSDVLNDCTNLCVPAYKGEPLSSILNKICAKIPPPSSGGGVITEEDPIFSGSPAFGISITDISHWDSAYNNQIVSAAFSGINPKILTLTQQDGGTITANFTDLADQIVTITEGAGIDVTGTYPNFTITHQDTSSVTNLDTSGAQVIDTLTFDTFGHVQTVTTRNLTLADLGYTVPNAERFGLSGEDDTATENRSFDLASFNFTITDGASRQLVIDRTNSQYFFGDVDDTGNGYKIEMSDNNTYIMLGQTTGVGLGSFIFMDSLLAHTLFQIGDNNGNYLLVNGTGSIGSAGLNTYQFGDIDSSLNGTQILLNDNTGAISWRDASLAGATNGYVWTLIDQTTGEGGWAASTGSGAIIDGIYRFDDSTVAADPGSGDLRFNNAVYASVTEIYISQLSDPGTDVGNILGTLEAGDVIYIQDRNDATKWFRADINAAPTDNGAWWTITVDYVNSGGTLFGNNQELNVLVSLNTASAGGYTDEQAQDAVFNAVIDGAGISTSYNDGANTFTITNTDLGSSQNIFKNIAVSGQNTVVADSNNDTLTLVAGTGVTITTDDTTDSITINASGSGTVNTGAALKAAYYPSAGTIVDDWIGVEFNNTNLNTKILSQATTQVLLELRMAASQSADPFVIKNSAGNNIVQIQPDGEALFTSDSTATLQDPDAFDHTFQTFGGNNARLLVSAGSGYSFRLVNSVGGVTAVYGGISGGFVGMETNNALNFVTNKLTRATFNNAGDFLINSTTDNGDFKLQVTGGVYADVTSKELRFVGVGTDNTSTQVYAKDGSGNVKLRDVSSISGSSGYTVHTVTTTPYTVVETSGKVVLLVDTSATGTNGNATINLPTAVGNTSEVVIKQILAANVITVDPNGTEEIDDASTYTGLTNINESISIINDNANWFII